MANIKWFVNSKIKKSVFIDMNRSQIRRTNIKYLEEFFSSIILFKDFPVKRTLRAESWAQDFYEQLNDEDKQALYNQITKK
jgi:hypothetical protein